MRRLRALKPTENRQTIPFCSGEEAWFWCCRCRLGDREKFCRQDNQNAKSCETNDIYISLRRLQYKGLIGPAHIKILVRFGMEQIPPSSRFGASRLQCFLWREAIDCLEQELRSKGIVE